jgi:alkylated DNA repair dioxygenase AlkB
VLPMDYLKMGLVMIPDFITEDEEKAIMSHIIKAKATKSKSRNTIKRFGSSLPYKSNMASKVIPPFLDAIASKLYDQNLLTAKPDSVTINEYFPGQGIAPHIDSKSSGDIITILSLLGSAKMDFVKGDKKFSIDYPARCLLQMKDEIRYSWMHSILKVNEIRYSLVFRKGT